MSILLNSSSHHKVRRSKIIIAISFYAIFFILVSYYGDWNGQILGITQREGNAVFLLAVSLLSLLMVVAWRKFLYIHLPYEQLIGVFLVNFFLISLFRPDIFSSLRQAVGVFCTVIILYTLIALLHSLKFADSLFVFSVSLFLTAMASLYVHLTQVGPLVFLGEHFSLLRLGGLFFYAQFSMMLGTLGILSMIGLFQKTTLPRRLFFVVGLILSSILLLATDTRSSIVSFVLCVIWVLFFQIQKFTWRAVASITLLLLIALLFFLYYMRSLGNLSNEFDMGVRMQIWQISVQGILSRSLTGYGAENYFATSSLARGYVDRLRDPHSAILSHALQYGMISLFLFMSYYLMVTLRTFRYAKTMRSVSALALFWFIAPFFWGYIYNISSGLVQIVFLLSLIGMMCHPDLSPVRSTQVVRHA